MSGTKNRHVTSIRMTPAADANLQRLVAETKRTQTSILDTAIRGMTAERLREFDAELDGPAAGNRPGAGRPRKERP